MLSRLDPFTPFANFHLDLHQSQAEGSPCCSWRNGSPQCLKFLPTAAKKKTLWNGWRHHGVLQTLVEHGTLELFGPFWNWRLTWLNCFSKGLFVVEMTPAWCDSHMLKLQMTFTFLRFPAWLRLIWCFWLPLPFCFATWSTTFSWSRKPTGSTGAYFNLCSPADAADQQTPGNDASKFGGWTVVCRVADVGKAAMAQFRGLGAKAVMMNVFFCICTAVRYYKLLWFSPICSKIVDDLLVVGNEDEGHSSWLFLAIYGSRCFLQWFRAGWSRTSCMLDVLREILSCCSRRLLTTKGICTTLWCGFSKGHLHMFEHLDDQHCDWPADLFAGCTQICALYRPDFIF